MVLRAAGTVSECRPQLACRVKWSGGWASAGVRHRGGGDLPRRAPSWPTLRSSAAGL